MNSLTWGLPFLEGPTHSCLWKVEHSKDLADSDQDPLVPKAQETLSTKWLSSLEDMETEIMKEDDNDS